MHYVDPAHPVLAVLRARRDTGHRRDGHKLGLVVQGGGMRGVLSGAMLTVLEDLGYATSFDAVYAASSGALNAAYFLAGGSWRQLAAYYDDLIEPAFIDLRRGFTGRLMDLDFAIEEILGRRKPLDVARILAADARLHIAVAMVDTMRTETFSDFTDGAQLKATLRASSWLPVAVRGVAELAGRPALDGAMLTIHPYRLAVADGCSHVLSLSSRRLGPVGGPYSPTEVVLAGWLERLRPGLGRLRRNAVRDYLDDRALLRARTLRPGRPPHLLDVAPLRWMPAVRPFERDPGRLIVAARHCYELLYRTMRGEPPPPGPGEGGLRVVVPRFTPVQEVDRDAAQPHDGTAADPAVRPA